MEEKLTIRDFIYLDVERMKSIYSQIDKGIMESYTDEKGDQKHVSSKGEASAGIFNFARLKGEIEGGILWENKQSETRSLHDHMYNLLESILYEHNEIYIINEIEDIENIWEEGNLNNLISDTSFVLVKGRVMLDDYRRMEDLISNFNDIGEALYDLEPDKEPEIELPKDRNKRKRVETQIKNQRDKKLKEMKLKMENKNINALSTLIKNFFKDRLILKMIPFINKTHLRFIGILDNDNLRENIDSIIFKYSSSPEATWSVFGQIAWIPSKEYQPERIIAENSIKIFDISDPDILNNLNMELSFDEGFNGIRVLDNALAVKFPYVIFTPIAVYRED